MKNISLTKDFLNSNKILFSFSEILKEYYSGKRDFYPAAVEIHPTAKCNHQCVHCSYTERNQNRASVDVRVMERLISSVIKMGVKAVYFSGGGEPALYPNLTHFVERLHDSRVEVALLTNGSYLKESGIIDIAHMFNYIAISVPAVDEEAFYGITGARNLQKVLSAPSAMKLAHKEKAPVIGARVVITGKIYRDTLTILEVLKDKGFDYALFKVVRDYEGTGLGLAAREESELRSMIESSGPFDGDYTNLGDLFAFKSPPVIKNCIINEAGLIANVNTDGTVFPNIVEIGREDFCVGNLNEANLDEIWNSERHQSVKRASREKCAAGLCENCRAIAYNRAIQDLTDMLPSAVDYFI